MARLDPKQQERLAAALRENLKRRKAQSRETAPKPPRDEEGEA